MTPPTPDDIRHLQAMLAELRQHIYACPMRCAARVERVMDRMESSIARLHDALVSTASVGD